MTGEPEERIGVGLLVGGILLVIASEIWMIRTGDFSWVSITVMFAGAWAAVISVGFLA